MTSYPSSIIAVLPERAAHRVSGMRLTAIQTRRGMWARKAITRGRDGRGRFGRTFATLSKRPVMVLGVGALAEGAERPGGKACRLGMTPTSAAGAERHTRIDARRGNDAGHPRYRDSTAREVSRTGSRLGVPDVKVEGASVGSARVTNNSGRGGKTDVVGMDRRREVAKSGLRGVASTLIKYEGDSADPKERTGGGDLTFNLVASRDVGACRVRSNDEIGGRRNSGSRDQKTSIRRTG